MKEIKDAFKDYDKKLSQLNKIGKILSDYCEDKSDDNELQEQCKHYSKMEALEKELAAHWEATAEERKRTHTGKMYKEYMEKKREKEDG